MKRTSKTIIAIIISQGLAGISSAAIPGVYLGGGMGYGSLSNITDFNSKKNSGGLGGKVSAGYNFNKHFGLELDYAMYPKTTYNINGLPNSTFNSKISTQAFNLLAKGYIPLGNNSPWDIYGMLGAARVNAKATTTVNIFDVTAKENAFRVAGGGGISRQFGQHFTAGVETLVTQGKNNSLIPQNILTTFNVAYHF